MMAGAIASDAGGTTLWRQIEQQLAGEIEHGRLAEGFRLPSEQQLAARFGVNRHTVRQAISALVDRGLIERLHGRGSYVREIVLDYPIRERTSFSANLLDQGLVPGHDIHSIAPGTADKRTAKILKLRAGAPIVVCHSVGSADTAPIGIGTNIFPQKRLAQIAHWLRREQSISKALARCGFSKFRRLNTRIYTRLPTDEEARLLKQPTSQPVLITDAVDVDLEGVPLNYGTTAFAGARVQITVG